MENEYSGSIELNEYSWGMRLCKLILEKGTLDGYLGFEL